jgi:2-polyprenyl-6-methoxyphenol hydroxylase-like FAD-dependent oxidoreductase
VVRPETWSRGRVVLLGDSAHGVHAFAGQGVNLGIQDAVALAGALRGSVDVTATTAAMAAFAEYERLRRPFVEWFQAYQLATPQLSGAEGGHPTLYGGLTDLMTRGQPQVDVTWVTSR